MRFFKFENGQVIELPDVMEWAVWIESPARVIEQTTVGATCVSTVFLGINYPALFETMIFGGRHDGYQERYTTVDAARQGHARAVALVSKRAITFNESEV